MHVPIAPTFRASIAAALAGGTLLAAAPAGLIAQTPAEEVRSLAEHPAVQRALGFIEGVDPRTIRELIELTQIPAPPFMEEARARVYAEWLRGAGADSVFIDEEGNAVAIRFGRGGARGSTAGGGRRTVALSGHLDTVFPEDVDVTVTQRGDTLFAPGVGDDTRGLMAVLTVLRALEASGIETEADVRFIGTVGEEGLGDLRGMKYLFREGADPIHTWIDVDGSGLGRIVNKGLGSHRFRVTFRGPGGHSWGAFGLANPAHALGRAIRHFQDVADTLTRPGPRTSYNVGRIGGGTSVNAIPFEAWMEVDMRSVSEESLARIDAAFRDAMRRALAEENALRRDGPEIELDLDQIGDRPSGEVADDHPLVQRASEVVRLFGGEPQLARSSTDSNIPIALGIPAVTIGSGGIGSGAHSPGEWWINRDGHLAIQAGLLLLVSEAGLAEPVP
ncbi:M20/M25/M40 family metallo-hydrolase [Candidatus Palauibacter sp.]|uniref:M20/M25/M40 family metallo-hydrolase n=1 Tax=Candidatus Palauibacter sp. TaxID=3101350 RepID=UPI003AF273EC